LYNQNCVIFNIVAFVYQPTPIINRATNFVLWRIPDTFEYGRVMFDYVLMIHLAGIVLIHHFKKNSIINYRYLTFITRYCVFFMSCSIFFETRILGICLFNLFNTVAYTAKVSLTTLTPRSCTCTNAVS